MSRIDQWELVLVRERDYWGWAFLWADLVWLLAAGTQLVLDRGRRVGLMRWRWGPMCGL